MRKLSVCLSVCLSVKRVNCDKMEERSVQILYHTKEHLDSLLRERMVCGGGRLRLPEILDQPAPVGAK